MGALCMIQATSVLVCLVRLAGSLTRTKESASKAPIAAFRDVSSAPAPVLTNVQHVRWAGYRTTRIAAFQTTRTSHRKRRRVATGRLLNAATSPTAASANNRVAALFALRALVPLVIWAIAVISAMLATVVSRNTTLMEVCHAVAHFLIARITK